ncbi:hypothetical protein ACFQZ4_01100 [Catellatospora coxensis]
MPANATTAADPSASSGSNTPASSSAGTSSTQPSWAARNSARSRPASRRDHSHRKNSGTTLCRWASTTKWYAGQVSDTAAAPARPSPAGASHRRGTACQTPAASTP